MVENLQMYLLSDFQYLEVDKMRWPNTFWLWNYTEIGNVYLSYSVQILQRINIKFILPKSKKWFGQALANFFSWAIFLPSWWHDKIEQLIYHNWWWLQTYVEKLPLVQSHCGRNNISLTLSHHHTYFDILVRPFFLPAKYKNGK